MKGAPLVVGGILAALLLPVLAIAAIAGAIVPAAPRASACVDSVVNTAGSWRPPLQGRYTITSRFGMRYHPVLHTTKLHTGIDLVAKSDPTIVAAASGTVEVRGFNAAYGNQVVIDHGDGVKTRYAHMASASPVTLGQRVTEGAKLGVQGATGYVTGAHLHFEVIENERPIDPAPFIARRGAPPDGGAARTVLSEAPRTSIRANNKVKALNAEQLRNAAIIVRVGRAVGSGDQGILIALMAALQESSLRNPDYGDRDSLGLFQQRAGWGSAQQRRDPDYAARAFFGGPTGPNKSSPPGLLDVGGWQSMPPGMAAQTVQVSAFPRAYDKWEPVARAILEQRGEEGADEQCASAGSSPGQARIATWNLCLEFCDGGKLRPWRERVPEIAAALQEEHPDIISLQETGRRNLQGAAIIAALSPDYKVAVYERSKMVLFDPSRFSTKSVDRAPLGSAEFVVHGKGGVAQVLRDKRTDATFVVSSLHPVDGNEEERRLRYLKRADAEVSSLARKQPGSVVIHAGDLNAHVPGSSVATFFAARELRSAEQVARTRSGQEYRSYNGGRPPRRGHRIDHVMIDPRTVIVNGWQQVLSARRDSPESDHHLIVADLALSGAAVPTGAPG